jgi:acetyl-CoA synthetase
LRQGVKRQGALTLRSGCGGARAACKQASAVLTATRGGEQPTAEHPQGAQRKHHRNGHQPNVIATFMENDEAMIRTMDDYRREYARSTQDPEGFWAGIAQEFYWHRTWDSVLEWDFTQPSVKWFDGATLNITENCLDRHLAERGDHPALIWEPNDPADASQTFTYRQLHQHVCRTAAMLRSLGVNKGDRVCIYLPMIPELAFAVLACARIGAIHSVVFAGFSARSLADRMLDAECTLLITADEALRGNKTVGLKVIADEALRECPSVSTCLVVKKTGAAVGWHERRDVWWHDAIIGGTDEHAEPVASEDPLFILYTSGSTGKPKGVVHTTAGYMVYAGYTFKNVFQYRPGDVYWCTADVGWITGHSYIIYGPLLNGATTIMFEGVPTWPDPGRFWQVVERHGVNIFYTAPTAIRALQACDADYVRRHNLQSLRVLGSVGEPINDEAWDWYHTEVGKGNCPIVDTWWQTETGGILISPLAGITPLKPTFATLPLPGIQPCLMDAGGKEMTETEAEGNLCIRFPWPGMIRTTWGDHERCRQTYFDTYKGYYFTGDGCRRDADGYYRITGRVDDVINVSGHRIGTAEVEDAINTHPMVVESAVVGFPHEIKGQGIYAYVICTGVDSDHNKLVAEIREQVNKEIGPIAKPDKIQVVSGLPKTRSGKIMRRILRKIAEGETSSLGDTSTLLDPTVVEEIIHGAQ